ncbi:MAG TPA: HD domain-containing phosphohydrolase [Candidatus Obscuribacterales bacterium]
METFEFMGLGLKSLTFYASMVLYAISLVYGLVILMMLAPKGGFKFGGGGRSGGLLKKKPSSYSMDDLLELSAQADAYEIAQDPYTGQYMADLAAQLAEHYELNAADRESLRIAALLHDIGQIGNYDFIQEERALRPEERQELEGHTLTGHQLLMEMGPEYEKAAKWVRWSHERWDGTGYPDGLAGEQIPIPARILGMVDAYCAMMSDRPYRPALGQQATITELQRFAGIQFDPQMVQLFGSEEESSESTLEVV